MYDDLFGITKYPYENPYLDTKLVPLSLGFTFVPFAKHITGPFRPAALPTRRTVIENNDSLQLFSWRGLFFTTKNIYLTLIEKEGGFIQIQLKVMIKTSKNITR